MRRQQAAQRLLLSEQQKPHHPYGGNLTVSFDGAQCFRQIQVGLALYSTNTQPWRKKAAAKVFKPCSGRRAVVTTRPMRFSAWEWPGIGPEA
ncbi:hypothetical protein LIP_2369 [Limnochorda pilosa]|uniref:Uncharacterized protein n=1 Tax=Limnochorda pilosa TaxID=1555112 RepID=A0A0K2SM80_LIMPI|nr:hypothetical protein LIP_2369 [Limnochorda pilosa]